MPRRGTKVRESYMGRYHAKPGVSLPGLTRCRVAAALSERDLAQLVGSNQTTINNLETQYWVKADYRLILRLCRVLKVRPKDLLSREPAQDETPRGGEQQESALKRERDERRRQVNRIKRQRAVFCDRASVRLGGLKGRRLEAGLTQRELARLVGTNQTTISELEKKYTGRGAYMKTVRKLCRALEVEPADLIGFDHAR